MIVAFINRLSGLLRPATAAGSPETVADHLRPQVPPKPAPAAHISPITIGMLEALGVRHAVAVGWIPHLSLAAHRYDIDTHPRRVAAWLATIVHESARLTRTTENLNYSAEGLAATWPARFARRDVLGGYLRDAKSAHIPNATATAIARKPVQIANQVYADRLGNGAPDTGDGWRYRGRGLIQITGRANYAASGRALDLDLEQQPELLEHPYTAALSAAEWWQRHGCNQLADTGDLDAVTRAVNGGLLGLTDRLQLYSRAMTYLGSA